MKKYIILSLIIVSTFNLFAQNVGIGTTSPRNPLSFAPSLGQKIAFWDDGNVSGNNYGIGVQSGLLQIHTYSKVDNISFGYGKSSALTERMRLINDGGDGLDLKGRIILRNGTNPINEAYGPGIVLQKPDNTGFLGFMGAKDNQNMGFFGGPLGWGLTYDVINSRLGINTPVTLNGNAGTAGQVLQSNGTATGVTWGSGTNLMYNLTNTYELASNTTLSSTNEVVNLPGLDQTINLPYNSKVIISFVTGGSNLGCFACPSVELVAFMYVDEDSKILNTMNCPNGGVNAALFESTSSTRVLTLSAGSHRFRMSFFRPSSTGGVIELRNGADVWGTRMTIIVIPQ